jgi:hypothetical protein
MVENDIKHLTEIAQKSKLQRSFSLKNIGNIWQWLQLFSP